MGDMAGKTFFRWKHGFRCGAVWSVSSADAHALCELKEFSSQPWFSHAKPCANGVSTVVGQILPSMLTLVSRPAPTLMSLRAELRHSREDPLCCVKLLWGCRRAGKAPLCLQNPFSRQRQAVSPKTPSRALQSGRKECIGDHVGCFSPGWPAGGFLETSGC